MEMELRDELEVPGHVLMIKAITKDEAISGIRKIMAKAEIRDCSKLKDISKSEKDEIKQYFDVLGLKHNDLEN